MQENDKRWVARQIRNNPYRLGQKVAYYVPGNINVTMETGVIKRKFYKNKGVMFIINRKEIPANYVTELITKLNKRRSLDATVTNASVQAIDKKSNI